MKTILSVFALTCLLACSACHHEDPGPDPTPTPTPFPTPTPQQQIELAKEAGQVAMLGFVAVEKPSAEEMTAIRATLDLIKTNVSSVKDGVFINALPGVKLALAKLYSKPEDQGKLAIAQMFAADFLAGIDALYAAHPDWIAIGDQAGAIVGAFIDGAEVGYTKSLKPCRLHPPAK